MNSSNSYRIDNIFDLTTAREIIGWFVQSLKYRANGCRAGQAFGQLIGDVARLQIWKDQHIRTAGNALMNVTYGYTASAGQMGTGTSGGNTGQLIGISGTINGQSRDQSFSYDTLGRLKTATGFAVWERRFEYDRWGNRTGMWDRRDGGTQLQNVAIQDAGAAKTNRIASVNGVNYSHDASGNVTSDGVHTFQYDAENRMVSVDAGVTARYTYDSNNWRVKKETEGVVTHYVWEGGQVVAEYEFGGNNTSGAGVRYYEPDRLSTRVITNGSGAVVGTLDQLPFGEEVGTAGESEKHKFTSYERDSETGTDYAVNRQYQNALGRFMRPDPYGGSMSITDPQSFNRYTYVGNDPINSIDLLGLQDGPFVDKNGVLQGASLSPESVDVVGHIDESGSGGGGGGHGIFGDGIIQAIAVSIDETGGLLFGGGGGGGDFFTPPVPLVPEPPAAPPQQEPQQPNGAACDKKLAGLFGSEGAVADTGRTPSTLQHSTAGMQRFSDHSAEGGVMHLYTNAQGTVPPNSVGLYVPAGFSAVPGGRGTVLNPPGGVNPGQVNYNYAQYRNAAGVTISFVHIGSPTGPVRNAAGSTLVGSIAGPGGEGAGYNHTHINFYSNFATSTRVDPRKLFCKEFGF